jgi:preprotein translocase subunit YajC
LLSIAFAMGTNSPGGGAGGAEAGGALGGMLVPMILTFAIFYFLFFRPQNKKTQEHRKMLDNIKKGDRVITSGGIHGRVTSVDDTVTTIEIADKVRIKVSKGSISSINLPPEK